MRKPAMNLSLLLVLIAICFTLNTNSCLCKKQNNKNEHTPKHDSNKGTGSSKSKELKSKMLPTYKEAKPGQFAFMAAVCVTFKPDNKTTPTGPDSFHSFQCGGSIINERFVLTSASCVNNDKTKYEVIVGTNQVKTGYSKHALKYNVAKVYKHEEYLKDPFSNNIALLELETSINFRKQSSDRASIGPINLNLNADDKLFINYFLTTVGWGSTLKSAAPELITPKLKFTNYQVKNLEYCNANHNETISKCNICAKLAIPGQPYEADYGGPLFFTDFSFAQPRFYQVGVANHVHRRGVIGETVLFSSVRYHLDWINDKMSNEKQIESGVSKRKHKIIPLR